MYLTVFINFRLPIMMYFIHFSFSCISIFRSVIIQLSSTFSDIFFRFFFAVFSKKFNYKVTILKNQAFIFSRLFCHLKETTKEPASRVPQYKTAAMLIFKPWLPFQYPYNIQSIQIHNTSGNSEAPSRTISTQVSGNSEAPSHVPAAKSVSQNTTRNAVHHRTRPWKRRRNDLQQAAPLQAPVLAPRPPAVLSTAATCSGAKARRRMQTFCQRPTGSPVLRRIPSPTYTRTRGKSNNWRRKGRSQPESWKELPVRQSASAGAKPLPRSLPSAQCRA